MAEPNPSEVAPWYLRNINQALALDEASGNVYIRTGFEGNIIISGNVNIPGNVDAHISEIGTSGNLTVPWMPVSIDGNSAVTVTSGNITVAQGTSPWITTGNANITGGNVTVSGTVAVSSVNSTVNANIVGGNVNAAVTGTVTSNQGTNPWVISGNVTTVGNITNDGKPWNLQVAQGLVSGITGLSISGYSANIGTTFIPAWEPSTAYTYLPSAQTIRVWSSSASDTNVTVLISGLDSAYNIQTESITLTNGTTGVLTTKQFFRVNNVSITGTVQNVGSIYVGSSDKSITLAFIGNATNVTAGRSQMTVYTVPAGYTFYLTQSSWYTNQTGSQTAFYRSWTKNPAGIVTVVLTFPMQQRYESLKVVPRAYPEKTDIQWQVASSSGTSQIGGQIEGYLIAN